MKQGVLYLQLQQTFGKVRGLGGGAARSPVGGGLSWAGHGGNGGVASEGNEMLLPVGSPTILRLPASTSGW